LDKKEIKKMATKNIFNIYVRLRDNIHQNNEKGENIENIKLKENDNNLNQVLNLFRKSQKNTIDLNEESKTL
jgi:hypothetical protein